MNPLHVSIIEQDPQLAERVVERLQSAGMTAHHCSQCEDFEHYCARHPVDVVVLDAAGLGQPGLEIAARFAKHPEVRVVMVDAHNEAQDRINSISAGADVCLRKPFDPQELVAIVQRLASRLPRTIKSGWTLDPARALLTAPSTNAIELTAMETVLLTQLAMAPDQALRSEVLELAIWGLSDYYNNKRLQVCVSRLRKKLICRHGSEQLLATCWRSTYQFVPRMQFAPVC